MDKQQIRAQFLGASSDTESFDQLREIHGHRMVVEFRGQYFKLCSCMGDLAQINIDRSREKQIAWDFPYILEGSMDSAAGFAVTNIIEGPAM